MTPARLIVLAVLVGIGLMGCYRTYSGNYFLSRASAPTLSETGTLPNTVFDAIEEFGFKPGYRDQSIVVYIHDPGAMPSNVSKLTGATARVHVAVTLTTQPRIAIRDMDNTKETEFVAALKRSLEKHLEERYGVRGLKFERTFDWLA